MRYAPRAILSGILGFAAAFVVACGGGSGLLSGGQASTLSSQLDRISSDVSQKNCADASSATLALASGIQSLPATVNPTLRRNLAQGVQTVSVLAQRDCHQTSATTPTTNTSTSTSTTTTSTTTTSPTTSTPTSTSTSTTTSTPTQTSTTTSPPPTTSSTATTPTRPGNTSIGSGGASPSGASGGTVAGNSTGNSSDNGNGNGRNAQ